MNKEDKDLTLEEFKSLSKYKKTRLMNESEFIEGYSMSTFSYNQDFEGNLLQAKNKYRLFGTSISNLIEQGILNVPNYIKIDVDGIEHKILSGAKQVLNNRNLKGMLIEINENYEEQYRSVIDVMEKFNFKIKYKKQSQFELPEKFKNTFNYIFERDEI